MKRAGITQGCGGTNYCPTDAVRRDAINVSYYVAEGACTGARSNIHVVTVDAGKYATASINWVRPTTNGAKTFVLCGLTNGTDQVANANAVAYGALTAPFGSTGSSTLSIQAEDVGGRP